MGNSNLADKYYDLVFKEEDSALYLMNLYCELFNLEPSMKIKRTFLKYVTLFGKKRVYLSLFILGLRRDNVSENINISSKYLEKILLSNLHSELFERKVRTSTDLTDNIKTTTDLINNKKNYNKEE